MYIYAEIGFEHIIVILNHSIKFKYTYLHAVYCSMIYNFFLYLLYHNNYLRILKNI